jgi:hypothetical protein
LLAIVSANLLCLLEEGRPAPPSAMEAPTTEDVRLAVRKAFAELGLDSASLAALEESLLVSDGRYLARTYAAGSFRAMWMIDVRLVQFYGPKGELLHTLDLTQGNQAIEQAARRAA